MGARMCYNWPMRYRLFVISSACLVISLASVGAAKAAPPQQTITIINQSPLSEHALARIEQALSKQARQARRVWHTPLVVFGPGGWPITLEATDTMIAEHSYSAESGPTGIISWIAALPDPATVAWWSVNLSHEVLEMLADPTQRSYTHGRQREICDPVSARAYRINRVWVQDFVTPAWYARSARGPWDHMQRLRHAAR